MINAILNADKSIIDYFSEEFEIKVNNDRKYRYIFPFVDILVEKMTGIKCSYTESVLKKCIKHNEYAYKKLKNMCDESDSVYENYSCEEFKYSEDGSMIVFRGATRKDYIVTNIIRVNKETGSAPLDDLIKKLNDLFNKILEIGKEKLL